MTLSSIAHAPAACRSCHGAVELQDTLCSATPCESFGLPARPPAVDLTGHCIMDGVRVPLPPPDAFALLAAKAEASGAAAPEAPST